MSKRPVRTAIIFARGGTGFGVIRKRGKPMTNLNFGNTDKYAQDGKLRDRIRAVIRGVIGLRPAPFDFQRKRLDDVLAHLQPSTSGTNISRLDIGINFHWENRLRSKTNDKTSCVLVILRQLIINYWDYLLEGSDESLKSDGQIENHLELLEGYVKNGLGVHVIVGDERQGYWLMGLGEYRAAMEDVR